MQERPTIETERLILRPFTLGDAPAVQRLAGERDIASTTLNIYAFRVGFEFFDIGYASAQMITLLAIVFGAVMAFSWLRRQTL